MEQGQKYKLPTGSALSTFSTTQLTKTKLYWRTTRQLSLISKAYILCGLCSVCGNKYISSLPFLFLFPCVSLLLCDHLKWKLISGSTTTIAFIPKNTYTQHSSQSGAGT